MTVLERTVDLTAATPAGVCGVLLELATTALADCGADPIQMSYVAAGAIAWDNCCGLLVAAPERIYRSDTFPLESVGIVCETADLVVDAVVLLLRCVPVLDDKGAPPGAADLDDAYTSALRDAAVIWNAVTGELPDGWQRANVAQTFVGAEGGCIGVETRLTIGLSQEYWCPTCTIEEDL